MTRDEEIGTQKVGLELPLQVRQQKGYTIKQYTALHTLPSMAVIAAEASSVDA